MSRKLFCLAVAVVVVGTICLSAYLASAAPPGPFKEPPGFENGNQSEQAEEAIDIHKPITPGGHYERLVLVHYGRKDKPPKPPKPDKPDKPGKPEPEEPEKDNDYYELLGLEWVVPEGGLYYEIDPDHAPEGSVEEIIDAFEAWDAETNIELFAGDPYVDSSVAPSVNAPDYVNTVSWRMVVPPSVIAVTFTWYNPDTSEMVDCDVVMNTKHDWGIDPDGEGPEHLKRAFDIRNIVTHEAGHVVGLADLYDEIYSELTMYGYSSKGETKKISLENGDVLGCQELYGE